PATAAIIGATVLGQTPTLAELVGIGLVMLALLIGARPDGSSSTAPPGAPPT
ncbi:MAG: hypothetical protein QOI28_2250, partial [Mycobacterium sp.]|nr:hypothetical protein [Mycobacterium sp.]